MNYDLNDLPLDMFLIKIVVIGNMGFIAMIIGYLIVG